MCDADEFDSEEIEILLSTTYFDIFFSFIDYVNYHSYVSICKLLDYSKNCVTKIIKIRLIFIMILKQNRHDKISKTTRVESNSRLDVEKKYLMILYIN